jgi:hypothetical protein
MAAGELVPVYFSPIEYRAIREPGCWYVRLTKAKVVQDSHHMNGINTLSFCPLSIPSPLFVKIFGCSVGGRCIWNGVASPNDRICTCSLSFFSLLIRM